MLIVCDIFFCLACAVLYDEVLQALLHAVGHSGADKGVLVFDANGYDVILIAYSATDVPHYEIHQIEVVGQRPSANVPPE